MKRWIQIDDDAKPEPYVHVEFGADGQIVYAKHKDGSVYEIRVHSKEERDALKEHWSASPGGPFDRVPMPIPPKADA